MNTFSIDNLRFIGNTNTQVRCLRIIVQIVRSIGRKHFPKDVLKAQLLEWSSTLENRSEDYRLHNGKLTDGGKPTVAYNRYLELVESLGLVNSLGNVFINTRLGDLLNLLTEEKNQYVFELTFKEKLFFLYLLFSKDADILILSLELIKNSPVKQSDVLKNFEQYIKERLITKQKTATTQAKALLSKKYITIQYDWQEIEVYAEHIVIPRLEWLSDIGLVKMSQLSGKTLYEIMPNGKHLYNSFFILPDSNIRDINEQWFYEKAFKNFAEFIFDRVTLTYWRDISLPEKRELLGELLLISYDKFNTGNAMRMALYPSMLYIALTLLCKKHIVIEFKDIALELKEEFKINNRAFIVRHAARINEGYIMVKII